MPKVELKRITLEMQNGNLHAHVIAQVNDTINYKNNWQAKNEQETGITQEPKAWVSISQEFPVYVGIDHEKLQEVWRLFSEQVDSIDTK